jgi:PKD repeat protein
MLQSVRVVLVLSFALVAQSFAGTTITPTTTLSAETGNNSSAANSFGASTNGNMDAGNVSKENVHKLLNAGMTAKVYAHFMAWWGSGGHIDIGYTSTNLTQVHNQVSDMMSRGIDGMIVDWYGQGNTNINQASFYVRQDAETRGGKFEFAIMEDQGSVHNCAYTAGCDATQALISDLNYIVSNYAVSPAYMRINGQPVIFTFDVENLPNIDWTKVMANVQGNPKIVMHNNQGFAKPYTSGSYAWVSIDTSNQNDWAQSYLDNFYNTSKSYPNMLVYPGTWKGFNDTAASWSQNRIMSQNCGQVWLQTFAELNKYFTGTQAQAVQLGTWNDYEEGTEIETGIDNCVSVSASATSAGAVSWTISGQENTIDHYSVFISSDGQNLMWLSDLPAGTHTYSLASFGFSAGNYTIFVKAVGKPSLRNKMSGAVPVTLIGNVAPTAKLSVTPSSGTVPVAVMASTAGSSDPDGTIASTLIDFGDGTAIAATSGAHTYSAPGTYVVTATVTDNNGATGTATATVMAEANQAPVASIAVTPSTGTAPVMVTASTVASTDSDGTVVNSTIDFGDGTVANGPVASHTYNNAGIYTVKGTVKDKGGLAATSSTTVTVSAAAFVVNAVSPTDASSITGPAHFVATTSSGSPVTAIRVYVDNVSVYAVNASSLDTTLTLTPGSHYVVLQAWNQAGQVAKTPLHITVANQPPSASLVVTPSGGVAPVVVSARASGTDADGTVMAMSIDFGDGTVVNGATGTHTYTVAGTYTVTAKVTDNSGATATAKSTVSVIPNGITLIRPARSSVVTSPVAVSATAGASNPIIAMRVYVDNQTMYSLNSFSSPVGTLDTTVAISKGVHNVVVQAWDSKGTVYKTSALITVQ